MKGVNFKNRLFLVTFLAILAFGCTKKEDNKNTTTNSGGPAANEVWIQGMAFNPSTITVTSGTKVTWSNKDGVTHTVTSDNNLFDSGNIPNGGTYSFTFTATGTYSYHCKIHSGMTAAVIVN
jgi:plastocyanin